MRTLGPSCAPTLFPRRLEAVNVRVRVRDRRLRLTLLLVLLLLVMEFERVTRGLRGEAKGTAAEAVGRAMAALEVA